MRINKTEVRQKLEQNYTDIRQNFTENRQKLDPKIILGIYIRN
jgi:hypothetical protein